MDRDPYFVRPPDKFATPPNQLAGGWAVIFLANLPVPLLFALGPTEKAGRVGMTLAILLMLYLGRLAVSRFRAAGLAVITGGVIVAVSQFVPLLQIIAGSIGLSVAAGPGKAPAQDLDGELGGFIATVVTGGILIAVALAFGAAIRWAWIGLVRLRARSLKPGLKPGSTEFP